MATEVTETTLRGPWLAAAWLALLSVVALAAVVFVAIFQLQPPDIGVQSIDATDVAFVVVLLALSSAVASVILWRRRRDWMAMLVAGALVVLPLHRGNGLEPDVVAANPEWAVPFALRDLSGFPLLFLLSYIFPNGRFVPRWMAAIFMVWMVLWLVGLLLGEHGQVYEPFQYASLGALALGLASQAYRYFRVSTPLERQQTKWVLLGLMGVLAAIGLWSLDFVYLHQFTGEEVSSIGIAMVPFVLLFFLMFPLTVGTAVLRYRLWDIDVLINRALVYAALTATLTGTYFGSVVLLQMALEGATGQGGNAVAVVISTLTIAALFMPLRRRIQNIIDRRLFRRRYDAARTLAAFSSRMSDEVDMGRLTSELVTVAEEVMQPAHASLWLRGHREI